MPANGCVPKTRRHVWDRFNLAKPGMTIKVVWWHSLLVKYSNRRIHPESLVGLCGLNRRQHYSIARVNKSYVGRYELHYACCNPASNCREAAPRVCTECSQHCVSGDMCYLSGGRNDILKAASLRTECRHTGVKQRWGVQ